MKSGRHTRYRQSDKFRQHNEYIYVFYPLKNKYQYFQIYESIILAEEKHVEP